MKPGQVLLFSFFSLIFILIFTTCSGGGAGMSGRGGGSSKGSSSGSNRNVSLTIKLSNTTGNSRSVSQWPPSAAMEREMEFKVIFSRNGKAHYTASSKGKTTFSVSVAAGIYDITVEAKYRGSPYGIGTARNQEIKAGEKNSVDILMYPDDTGSGGSGGTGDPGGPGKPGTFTVTFNSNGGSAVPPRTGVVSGTTITAPTAPTKTSGYERIFDGWYKEPSLTNIWNFNIDTITTSITLYAKWRPYNIGETGPAGGVIFYRAQNGFLVQEPSGGVPSGMTSWTAYTAYYLEAAPTNLSGTFAWSSSTTDLIPNLSQTGETIDNAIGRGRMNTAIIINRGANFSPSYTTPAANACTALTTGNRNDWFLPSKDELYEMYIASTDGVPGLPTTGNFWSSSQSTVNTAWLQEFDGGTQSATFKNATLNIARAIRAF